MQYVFLAINSKYVCVSVINILYVCEAKYKFIKSANKLCTYMCNAHFTFENISCFTNSTISLY